MNKYLDVILLGVLLFLTIGYNVFSTENTVNKGIYYDNFNYTDNVVLNSVDGTNLNFSGKLCNPGDYYELSFDVVNSTNTDVKITDLIKQNNDKYINYQLTYKDGSIIKAGDILKKGEVRGINYKVFYKNPIIEDNYSFDSSFNINYEQVI